MTKPELLAPAGNIEALKAAIHNGADAVYISGKNFGARAFAENFTNDQIIDAINYAHLYNVKIYVTTNTIIYENEIEEFINYIKFLYINNVDAVIMQDIGMINLIRNLIPNLEIHASTQAHNCNDETLKYFKNIGVKRIVLARELSLKQINTLKTNIEKEIFIHGALCICYSGCCLFSSLNGNRSGNRGKCAGPCRLPYTLIKNKEPLKTDGKYLLSTKELNTSSKIDDILNSNVQSLKIEGRLKSPEYVALVTKMYRNLIDGKTANQNTEKKLKTIFNRKFTLGHIFQDENLMNIATPNHIGIEIGKVINVNNKIKIKLTENLSQNDGIRFKQSNKGMIVNKLYNEKGLLINKANKGEIIYLDNKINLKTKDTLLKTIDYNLNQELKHYSTKKIPIDISVEAYLNKPLKITIKENNHTITKEGSKITKALNTPTTKETITEKLSRLGNTPFTPNKININKDNNIFIRIGELNELRRQSIEELIKLKTKKRKLSIKPYNITPSKNEKQINITASVQTEKQLITLIDKADKIYLDNYELYKKYKNNKIYFKPNRTNYKLQDFKNENLLIGDLGSLNKYHQNNNCQTDYFLNVVNSYSVNYLNKNNIKNVTLSPELNINQIINLTKNSNNTEIIIYGALELMVINYCLIKHNDKCPNCKNNKYYLKNIKNELFPIITKNCQTHIIHHKKINLINKIPILKENNITNFRLEFTNETPEEILNIIQKVKQVIN